jgi:prepilin-type N-terminal cleavage/methylation domain-containing protein
LFIYGFKKKSSRGFTLLEVMISVAIIAFVFVSIFRMQSSTIDLATAGNFNTFAPMLAEKLLNDVANDLADWSEFEGDFSDSFPGIQWHLEISETFFETDDLISKDNQERFKKIEIEIISSSGSRSYKINTWRLADE